MIDVLKSPYIPKHIHTNLFIFIPEKNKKTLSKTTFFKINVKYLITHKHKKIEMEEKNGKQKKK